MGQMEQGGGRQKSGTGGGTLKQHDSDGKGKTMAKSNRSGMVSRPTVAADLLRTLNWRNRGALAQKTLKNKANEELDTVKKKER